jgi:hypothetical protein
MFRRHSGTSMMPDVLAALDNQFDRRWLPLCDSCTRRVSATGNGQLLLLYVTKLICFRGA